MAEVAFYALEGRATPSATTTDVVAGDDWVIEWRDAISVITGGKSPMELSLSQSLPHPPLTHPTRDCGLTTRSTTLPLLPSTTRVCARLLPTGPGCRCVGVDGQMLEGDALN